MSEVYSCQEDTKTFTEMPQIISVRREEVITRGENHYFDDILTVTTSSVMLFFNIPFGYVLACKFECCCQEVRKRVCKKVLKMVQNGMLTNPEI